MWIVSVAASHTHRRSTPRVINRPTTSKADTNIPVGLCFLYWGRRWRLQLLSLRADLPPPSPHRAHMRPPLASLSRPHPPISISHACSCAGPTVRASPRRAPAASATQKGPEEAHLSADRREEPASAETKAVGLARSPPPSSVHFLGWSLWFYRRWWPCHCIAPLIPHSRLHPWQVCACMCVVKGWFDPVVRCANAAASAPECY